MRLPLASEAALGNRDQCTRPAAAALGTKTSASNPLLKGSFRAAGGSGTTSPGERVKPFLKSNRSTWLTAFEADINEGTVERDRLRVKPAARGDRRCCRTPHRRGLDVVKPRSSRGLDRRCGR